MGVQSFTNISKIIESFSRRNERKQKRYAPQLRRNYFSFVFIALLNATSFPGNM